MRVVRRSATHQVIAVGQIAQALRRHASAGIAARWERNTIGRATAQQLAETPTHAIHAVVATTLA